MGLSMEKRKFPLFLIDRSKHYSYPFDFIVCTDKNVGFVARVISISDDLNFVDFVSKLNDDQKFISVKLRNGGIIIVVETFLYDFVITKETDQRIQTLLKKGLKKFLHAEVDKIPGALSIDDQIKQQQLTIEQAKANYEKLVERCQGNKNISDYQIQLAEAILDSLKILKDLERIPIKSFLN